jgi:hypothetical protein
MIPTITADVETLSRQASMTVSDYMRDAVSAIDDQFGAGYAKSHPALVGAYLGACARDFETAMVVGQLQRIEAVLAERGE